MLTNTPGMNQSDGSGLNEAMDLAMGHALGELSPQERVKAEEMLRSGDPQFTLAYHSAQQVLSELPNVLRPVTPPPFVKERVTARVREMNAAEARAQNSSQISRAFRPTPRGMVRAASYMQRGVVFAGMVMGMMLTTAYASDAVEDIIHAIKTSREVNEKKVTHVWTRIHREEAAALKLALSEAANPIVVEESAKTTDPEIGTADLRHIAADRLKSA